jgi:hypothetical protein
MFWEKLGTERLKTFRFRALKPNFAAKSTKTTESGAAPLPDLFFDTVSWKNNATWKRASQEEGLAPAL